MDPVVVTIPHRHGKAEATRRIKAGIEDIRARYPAQLKIAEENWEGVACAFAPPCSARRSRDHRCRRPGGSHRGGADAWLMGHLVKPGPRR